MKSVIKIKIPYNKSLVETMKQYSYSANKVIDFGWNIQTDNKRELHDLTYYKIRQETELPAQLVCSSRDKAAEVLKSKPITKPILKEHLTIRYDARSFSFKYNKEEVGDVRWFTRKELANFLEDNESECVPLLKEIITKLKLI